MGLGTLICGRTYDYNNLCGLGSKYDEYVQPHEKTTTHNESSNCWCSYITTLW